MWEIDTITFPILQMKKESHREFKEFCWRPQSKYVVNSEGASSKAHAPKHFISHLHSEELVDSCDSKDRTGQKSEIPEWAWPGVPVLPSVIPGCKCLSFSPAVNTKSVSLFWTLWKNALVCSSLVLTPKQGETVVNCRQFTPHRWATIKAKDVCKEPQFSRVRPQLPARGEQKETCPHDLLEVLSADSHLEYEASGVVPRSICINISEYAFPLDILRTKVKER